MIDSELLRYLESEPLLGNVRELENAVQRMLFLKCEGTSLLLEDWIGQLGSEKPQGDTDLLEESARAMWRTISRSGVGYEKVLQELERRLLETATSLPGSTRRGIAQQLHMSERSLYYKMKARGITKHLPPV
jgi:DNA-binding NtrC family response regulator